LNHPALAVVVHNTYRDPSENARVRAETRHRDLALVLARDFFEFSWCFCFVVDERYIGLIYDFVRAPEAENIDRVRVRLFDAYLTPEDQIQLNKGNHVWMHASFSSPSGAIF
jgi:hypothetical protein